jgi:hypothetical protein
MLVAPAAIDSSVILVGTEIRFFDPACEIGHSGCARAPLEKKVVFLDN